MILKYARFVALCSNYRDTMYGLPEVGRYLPILIVNIMMLKLLYIIWPVNNIIPCCVRRNRLQF